MKIKYKKGLVLTGLVASIIFTSFQSSAVEILYNHNNKEKIYLNGKEIELPKEIKVDTKEFRGVWVSTVYNLDFPKKKGLSKEEFKKGYLELLDNVQDLGLNTIIYQVRPKGDTFYKSELNPWSEYLTGKEDLSPGWDPLDWMVEQTHKRGLKFHAWFNPYRVTTNSSFTSSKLEDLSKLSEKNWARKNPDYVFKYDGKLYLNPAEPEVVNFINETIMEVVENYDVDGVHLDDYFYPSKRVNTEDFYSIEEKNSYEKYGSNYGRVSDWRRDNVTNLVSKLSNSIRNYNKNYDKKIKFGISPFGIWGHKSDHPEGSKEGVGSNTPVGSMASYDYQFADTRKWVKDNLLDYIAPQIYWTFDEKAAPYAELVDWWSRQVKGTDVDLYIGHANYKKKELISDPRWSNEKEISNQLKFNSLYDEVKGSIFFRYESLLKDKKNIANNKFIDILKNKHYRNITTSSNGKDIEEEKTNNEKREIYDLNIKASIFGNVLEWKDSKDSENEYYSVYREEVISGGYKDKKKLGNVFKSKKQIEMGFLDDSSEFGKSYRYTIISYKDNEQKNMIRITL